MSQGIVSVPLKILHQRPRMDSALWIFWTPLPLFPLHGLTAHRSLTLYQQSEGVFFFRAFNVSLIIARDCPITSWISRDILLRSSSVAYTILEARLCAILSILTFSIALVTRWSNICDEKGLVI